MAHTTNGHGGAHAATARILAARQVETERYTSKAWGIDLELHGLTLGQRTEMMEHGMKAGGAPDAPRQPVYARFYPIVLRAGCYDPDDHTPVFHDGVTDEQILALNSGECDRVASRILTLSGLDKDADKALSGDSGGTTTSISATSSRASSGAPSRS